ncbi:phosphotransferase enzyme family protein [Flavihumibacter stibioxidans]|uniref:Aminoglycoside phosphotransferase domain-containing protein n=1 Tax=Flavihumibacter stibioxidans TaxID=1834163 RepID=A0ABR7M471_9BACT|nr:phosphotransferase [Flavihumibacter stibioxidans]MBC6489787.1 hypothetical protein [Flavihumibacter stibioxidans]
MGTELIIPEFVAKAAAQFGSGAFTIVNLGNGLIHDTFRVSYEGSPDIVLQSLNQQSFAHPENIILNYRMLIDYLQYRQEKIRIPVMVPTNEGKWFWIQEPEEDETIRFWRATRFIRNCFSPDKAVSVAMAREAAGAYADFTKSLDGIRLDNWNFIIPDFHNLYVRYEHLEEATRQAELQRLLKATHIIASLRERKHYVDFYLDMIQRPADFPDRLMHHDCKINNILFDADLHHAIAVADLDTVMPGKYFSDLGDMIRTMACTEDENSREWEKIGVNREFYFAIIEEYGSRMSETLTEAEMAHLPEAGLLLCYMQALRFTADYLNNDIYYKTTEPDHNLFRAFNQLILLEKLEEIHSLRAPDSK